MRTIGVSIAIPEPWGSQLQDLRDGFGDPLARAIPTHVTLLPPTEVEDTAIAEVEGHLAAVAAAERAFPMLLRGTGTFRPTSPVVFIQVARGITDCERLEQAVRSGPLLRGLHFPYHPHVTVAHHLPDDVLDRAFDKLSGYEARFQVGGFSLYEHGADEIWRPRRAFPFGGGPAA
ncbi:2'-5' RNA ligase family protein [Yinghuangia seranimata]|uniref:2'-5' RNA ligase family protein n=1 Tax=Yinghuangia seranimata TaxID=408067 RepID=UPI00248C54E4|nr:2'-5' RNA ligase family protein [Yinghuangia seranimata]MDI2126763.1 2'-5' RNA ligase family protein [Yinghuangia seranimata]